MILLDHVIDVFAYTSFVVRNAHDPELTVEGVREKLDGALDRAVASCQADNIDSEIIRLALFAVVAWADETLITSSWPGSTQWQHESLQRRRFHTRNAGREFYEKLSELPKDARGVREVYEYCLALGFRGKYYRREDENDRQNLAAENLRQITGAPTIDYPRRLFPHAYSGVDNITMRKRPPISLFNLAATIIPVAFFVGLYALYDKILDRLIAGLFGG